MSSLKSPRKLKGSCIGLKVWDSHNFEQALMRCSWSETKENLPCLLSFSPCQIIGMLDKSVFFFHL